MTQNKQKYLFHASKIAFGFRNFVSNFLKFELTETFEGILVHIQYVFIKLGIFHIYIMNLGIIVYRPSTL